MCLVHQKFWLASRQYEKIDVPLNIFCDKLEDKIEKTKDLTLKPRLFFSMNCSRFFASAKSREK